MHPDHSFSQKNVKFICIRGRDFNQNFICVIGGDFFLNLRNRRKIDFAERVKRISLPQLKNFNGEYEKCREGNAPVAETQRA
jgi:hypothetical protein